MSCCKRPNIANMDHIKGFEPERVPMVNRVCLNCSTHWYGPAGGEIRQYSMVEWDTMQRAAMDAERVNAQQE